MTDQIHQDFSDRGVSQGGECYYPLNVALELVESCNAKSVAVIGIEFFAFVGGRIQALPTVNGADWDDLLSADTWDAAVTACNQATQLVLQDYAGTNPDHYCCLELLDQSEW